MACEFHGAPDDNKRTILGLLMAEHLGHGSTQKEQPICGKNSTASDDNWTAIGAHLSGVQKRNQRQDRSQGSIPGHSNNNSSLVLNPYHVAHYLNQSGPLLPPQPRYYCFPFYNPVVQQSIRNHFYFHSSVQQQQTQVHTQSTMSNNENASMNGLRFWEALVPDCDSPGLVFSVMSYNILAQDLLDQHSYLYRYHKSQDLKWDVRWQKILAEIKTLNPDILCMQEVQGSHIKRYFSALHELGYRGIYKQRTGLRTDGCGLYYKHDLVKMVEHITVEYNQPQCPILNRDNVAIIAKFASKKDKSKEFVVATTHLLYNPKRNDVRLAQTQLLLAELDRIAFKGGDRGNYVPVIVTGDLNSPPNTELYELITRGQVGYKHLAKSSREQWLVPTEMRITDHCQHHDLVEKRKANGYLPRDEEEKICKLQHSERERDNVKTSTVNNDVEEIIDPNLFCSGTLKHRFDLKSVYGHGKPDNPEGTTFQERWLSVDYIFYSYKRENCGKLKLFSRYKLPTGSELGDMKIPNKLVGSDHLSLAARFKLLD